MKQMQAHAVRTIVPGILILLALITYSFGCAGSGKPQPEYPPNEEIRTLLVSPFKNQSLLHGEGETYRCSLCGGMFTTGRVEKDAALFVTDNIVGALGARQTITLVSNDRVETLRRQLLIENDQEPSEPVILTEIGRKLGADAVLTGSVYRFIQRVGSDFAADSPASIGLDFDLIDVKTGRLLWHARLDETQEYLTNNFLKIFAFFRRGGKWVTAEKLAAAGIEKVLEGSPIP